MANLNKVFLMGNLTRDPQLKYLPSQTAVAEFGLAMNRRWKGANGEDREEVCFVDCSAFGKTAEVINQYFQKGKPIFVEGRLKLDQWEDKQGGGKRSRLTVVVDNFQFIGGRDGGGGGGAEGDAQGQPPRAARPAPTRPPQTPRPSATDGSSQTPPDQPPFGNEEQFKENDIPF